MRNKWKKPWNGTAAPILNRVQTKLDVSNKQNPSSKKNVQYFIPTALHKYYPDVCNENKWTSPSAAALIACMCLHMFTWWAAWLHVAADSNDLPRLRANRGWLGPGFCYTALKSKYLGAKALTVAVSIVLTHMPRSRGLAGFSTKPHVIFIWPR